MLCAVAALYIANSQWSTAYHHILELPLAFRDLNYQRLCIIACEPFRFYLVVFYFKETLKRTTGNFIYAIFRVELNIKDRNIIKYSDPIIKCQLSAASSCRSSNKIYHLWQTSKTDIQRLTSAVK